MRVSFFHRLHFVVSKRRLISVGPLCVIDFLINRLNDVLALLERIVKALFTAD